MRFPSETSSELHPEAMSPLIAMGWPAASAASVRAVPSQPGRGRTRALRWRCTAPFETSLEGDNAGHRRWRSAARCTAFRRFGDRVADCGAHARRLSCCLKARYM